MVVQNLEDLIEQVRQQTRIERVIEDTPGFSVVGHGRYLSTREHDSLVIDTHNNSYFWNAQGEHGDAIEWVCKRNGWDFKTAIEELTKLLGLPAPEWSKGNPGQRLAARARQDIFEIAANVFAGWLWQDDDALAYARGRAWTDETIKRARLGYTGGRETPTDVKTLLENAIVTCGADPQSSAAVALVGYSGDVKRWSLDHDVEISNQDWIDENRIPGILRRDMLVYPHIFAGRCCYLSLRGVHEKNHYNLPIDLVGSKQVFANWEWSSQATQCVIVEGQADAITLAQWGLPAVALCGVSADEHVARMLGADDDRIKVDFYVGLDADAAGSKNSEKMLELLGPMTRVLQWDKVCQINTFVDPATGEEKPVKDANDLLRGMK